MATKKDDIRRWFDEGVDSGYDFMIVVCDTYDWTDYPKFCAADQFVKQYKASFGNMQKVMEVYDLSMDREEQINETRSHHYPKDFTK